MSTESAFGLAKEVNSLSQELVSQLDTDDHAPIDPDPLTDGDGFQCGHLCHGHASNITSEHFQLVARISNNYQVLDAAAPPSHSQAPPTPPPNI